VDFKSGAQFTLASCPVCAEQVLTYADLNTEGLLVHKCLSCDATVQDEVRAVPGQQLAEHGYTIDEPGGCGSGCGSGGCGVRAASASPH